eukprot:4692824-Amphidinium_carterae.1
MRLETDPARTGAVSKRVPGMAEFRKARRAVLAVFLLGTFLTRSPSGKHTTSVALYDDALLSHQSCLQTVA